MLIGCPREVKPQEFRVGLTPGAAKEAVGRGHRVLVEAGAGVGSGFADAAYEAAGAEVVGTPEEVFARAELIVKVKEPQAGERARLRAGQVLFTYLHLAPDPEQTRDLMASGVTAIAYETVTDAGGGLPLLAPMSEVAGEAGAAGGRLDAAEGERRAGRAARRRAGRGAGEGGGDRRRRGRDARGAGGGGHGGGGGGARPVAGAAAPSRRGFGRGVPDAACVAGGDRGGGGGGGPGDRRGADPGRGGAEAGRPRAAGGACSRGR